MSKRTILIATVVILALIGWYFNKQKNSILSSHDFIIADSSNVDKIVFEKANHILKLEKVNGLWFVNDTFQVNYPIVKRFLRVFTMLDLVAPISGNSTDTVLSNLNNTGVKISVFDNKHVLKKYLLGHLNASGSGNIVFLDDEKLAIVNSTGLVKDLNSIISLNSLYWRNRIVFNKSASKITQITHKNISKPDKSYTIYANNGEYSLFNHNNEQIKEVNQTAIQRYLSYFQNISFKQIENSLTHLQFDSLLEHNHAHTILLVDNSGINYELNLYYKPAKISENTLNKDIDLNQIYGIMNNEENILIFEYYVIDPILKDIDYFVKK